MDQNEQHLPLGHTFVRSSRITSYTQNACMRCGKTEAAHKVKLPTIKIVFRGKVYDFKNWKEAMEHGFYLY